jgi:hypothetical protein
MEDTINEVIVHLGEDSDNYNANLRIMLKRRKK